MIKLKSPSFFLACLLAAFFGKLVIPTYAFLGFGGSNKGAGKISLFFHSIPYAFKKLGCSKWVRQATNDDIVENKYIYIDLFSRTHHHAIEQHKQEDDTLNRRYNIIKFVINSDLLPPEFHGATFGDVYYYKQLLQEDGEYELRKLTTYNDDLKRYCVFIESFDVQGARTSMRLYRAKRTAWWLKEVASEGNVLTDTWNSLLSTIGYTSEAPEVRYTLNIKESNCPVGITNYKSSTYDLIYNTNPGSGLSFIGDVIFRSMPMALPPTLTDLYVWRYFKGSHENITHVVVAELFHSYSNLTFFRCTSPKDSKYEEIDSFAATEPTEGLPDMIDTYPKFNITPLNMEYDFGANVEHPFIQGIFILTYPHARHHLLRPLDERDLMLIKQLQVVGEHNQLNLLVDNGNSYTYAAFTTMDADTMCEISLTSVNASSIAIASGQIALSGTVNPDTASVDQHTISLFKNEIPVHYLGMEPKDAPLPKPAIDFDMLTYNDANVLAAQFRPGITFYTPNLLGTTNFNRCNSGGSEIARLEKSFNTQIFFIEDAKKSLIAVFQGDASTAKIYDINQKSEVTNSNQKFKHLTEHGLADLEHMTKEKTEREFNVVLLNLNSPMLDDHVEIMTISTNVVVYLPAGPDTRIGAVVWRRKQLEFDPENNPMVTVINNGLKKYLLVDEYVPKENTIKRLLYNMEILPTSERLRLVSQITCKLDDDGIYSARECLSQSWYRLINQSLPVHADFNDIRIGKADYSFNKLTVLYMPHGHDFTVGPIKVKSQDIDTPVGHRWRQIHRQVVDTIATTSVYTMTPKGIEQKLVDAEGNTTSTEVVNFKRNVLHKVKEGFTPLMLDHIDQCGMKLSISKIGQMRVTVVKPEASSSGFNPLVFGQHEIILSQNDKCNKVTISEQADGLREIQLDIINSKGETVGVTFREKTAGSGFFNFDSESKKLPYFLDVKRPINNITKYFDKLNTLDFNKGIFPHYVRYLTLNKDRMYFTGNTMHTGLNIAFGSYKVEIPHSDEGFHIWVHYQTKSAEIATLYLQYNSPRGIETTFYSLENANEVKALKRPTDANCNWGPLSNLEFYVVNHLLVRHTQTKHDLTGIDLHINSDLDQTIMKMEMDEQTTLYTTLASSGCIIDDIIHKNVIVRGMPKQLVKHVYHSKGPSDELLLVVTRTVKAVISQAYRFGANGSFEAVDPSAINSQEHGAIHTILSNTKKSV
ncbi:sensory transduction kinase, putative [Babesia ovis]|uniref:Sensory transduction kinase, putative n=1 Tax=Babesia ovis TaxID=5869 RepID=A0A9W5WVY6_BABOV|nr:sensory transduction kinase, putative [Babesia ovis]